ncbi:hypothetical protein ACFQX7_37620 [Luedemannella flava]
MTRPRVRGAARATLSLLAVPLGLEVAMVAAMTMGVILTGMVVPTASARVVFGVTAATVIPVALLAWWWARRLGRAGTIAAPAVTAPTAMATVLVITAIGPAVVLPGDSMAYTLSTVGLATAAWCAALLLVGAVVQRVRVRFGARAAAVTAVIGGLVALELSTIVNVLAARDATVLPREYALVWYPLSVTGLGLDPGGDLIDAVGILPGLLTLYTLFALRFAAVAADRRRAAEPALAPTA